jgi:DNA-binding response OmpR family regulator
MQGMHAEAAPHPVILVVEGLEPLRESMQQILEDADFLVLPAANASQALELAQSCAAPINLLITTLHPGGMPGPDLVFRLRKRSPEMNVLYSSANPLVSSMLPRPFSKTTLLRRINILLAGHT